MATNKEKLEKVFELIQDDQLDDASALLKPILKDEPTNADAWWLLANTVSEPREARQALVNVLKYDPKHRQARDMLETLNELYVPRDDELLLMLEIKNQDDDLVEDELLSDEDMFKVFEGEADLDLSDFDDLEDDDLDDDLFAELSEKKPIKSIKKPIEEKKRRSLLVPVTLVAIAALIATGLFALSNRDKSETQTKGTPDLVALTSLENSPPELSSVVNQVDSEARNQFGESSSALLTSNETVVIETCVCLNTRCNGPSISQMQQIIVDSFLLIAAQSPAEVVQAGVNVSTCGDNPDALYRAYTSIQSVLDYQSSQDLAAFQAVWGVE